MNPDKQIVLAAQRSNLTWFVRNVFATVNPGEIYQHAWYIDALTYHLMQLVGGPKRRLIINMPPRHLKSIITSVAYPAWLLGHHPHLKILCVSYSPELATSFSKLTRQVMEAPWYREVFPNTVLSDSDNSQDLITTTHKGCRRAVFVGGVLTGLGGDVILIDDPQKADDVLYPNKRLQSFTSYTQTIASRLNDPTKGVIVLVQQRLHEEDWSGRLLESGLWTHLNLPAIAEQTEVVAIGQDKAHTRSPGDILHPDLWQKSALDEKRLEIGKGPFEAQYQQQPGPGGDGYVIWEQFRRYDDLPAIEPEDKIIQSWDIGVTLDPSSSYSVCSTWLYHNHCFYLMDVQKIKKLYPDLRLFVPQFANHKKANVVVIETSGVGLVLWQDLFPQEPLRYLSSNPKAPKEIRLMVMSTFIAAGRVWLPKKASWLDAFRTELLHFPNGTHDDQVDSMTQALRWLELKAPKPPHDWKAPEAT